MFFKSAFTVGIVLVMLAPAVVGYALQLRLGIFAEFAISVYGIYSLLYLIVQIVCAEVNNWKMSNDKKSREDAWAGLGVGAIVVGYREKADLLKRCLESIKSSKYANIKRIVFVIDGNSDSDMYMADVYKSVFNNNVVKVDFLISNAGDACDYTLFNMTRNICVMQPHGGKREGLYTGFKLLMQDPDVQVVVTTDSDTILDENAITELVYASRHEHVGAVAGQIEVWNKSDSLLAHIVAYRYWFSFNLERACESFWNTVLCVAGPMACYKMDTLRVILDDWFNQKFLGAPCTFGDDRHLTNRVLLQGKKVVYTPFALGYTDTPRDFATYFRQQTRWSKSYFREFLYNMQSIHLHPIWMCYELCYHIVYFFLLMYWFVYILYFGNIYQQTLAILITMGMVLIKCVYGGIKARNWAFVFFYLYIFVYFLVLIPAKIIALLTLWDTRWGTRGSRSNGVVTWFATYWSVLLWYGTLAGGFAWMIYKNLEFQFEDFRYKVAFIGFIVYIGVLLETLFVEFVLRRLNKFESRLEASIRTARRQTREVV